MTDSAYDDPRGTDRRPDGSVVGIDGRPAVSTAEAGPPTDPNERARELLARSSRGDDAAFAELYDLVSARVYGMALRVVRDPAQAEEVTQETFVDVWRQSARYDASRGSVISWVLTVAHRRAVDRVRSSEAARQRDDAYDVRNRERERDTTVDAVERSLDRERVTQAMRGLTDLQRSALELAYFGGYTHSEVAALLDLPLGTAKTRIRDGLIRLRDALGVAR
ncbi:ECF RNA polymerase sigma factor SigK [Cumulibacter manganitolerans]|uniref:ECF RNA polymerase sigma factor SigK n=1 Tax=Cumulibacter manganitolerans TaxID=1884992 RepID=UPI001296D22F|nr:ECF RNA polymerase sigma factor SigK [Cumulibacter manganitolerans]